MPTPEAPYYPPVLFVDPRNLFLHIRVIAGDHRLSHAERLRCIEAALNENERLWK